MEANRQPEFRRQLEDLWRNRLQKALDRYSLAMEECQTILREAGEGLVTSPDGSQAVRQARIKESAARDEYMRALRTFTHLIIKGERPGER